MNAVMTLELGGRIFKLNDAYINIIGDGENLTISARSVSYPDLYMFAVGYNAAMNRKAWEAV